MPIVTHSFLYLSDSGPWSSLSKRNSGLAQLQNRDVILSLWGKDMEHPPRLTHRSVTTSLRNQGNHKPQHLPSKRKPCFRHSPTASPHSEQTEHSLRFLRWRRESCLYACTQVHAGRSSDTLVRGTLWGPGKITEKKGFTCAKATSGGAYK